MARTRHRAYGTFAILLAGAILLSVSPAADAGVRALPVAAAPMRPGEVISAKHLRLREFHTTARSLEGIATSESQLIGKQLRRRLRPGYPISLAAIGDVVVVKRGGRLMGIFTQDGLEVLSPLIALEDGTVGATISGRNPETNVIVTGVVDAGGLLRVSP